MPSPALTIRPVTPADDPAPPAPPRGARPCSGGRAPPPPRRSRPPRARSCPTRWCRPPISCARCARSARRLAEQVLQVQLAAGERKPALGVARPLLRWAVPVELDVVAVGVGDVDRLVRAVVGQLAQRPVDRLQAAPRVRPA